MILILAWKEFIRSWRLSLFFIFNLAMGLSSYIAVESFKVVLQNEVTANSKSILGADLAITARRSISDQEVTYFREILPLAEESIVYEFFAMMKTDQQTRLVMVKAIDDRYPLYGDLIMQSGNVVNKVSSKSDLLEKAIWVYPELKDQLGIGIGSEVEIGNLKLHVSQLIKQDLTQTFRAASMAPRVFIHKKWLEQTGLIKTGSTYSLSYLYALPEALSAEKIKSAIYNKISDPQIHVETGKSAGDSASRQLSYLSDYLGLVSLISILLSCLGSFYIYRLIINSRKKEIAILRALGMLPRKALYISLIHIALIGAFALIPSVLLAQIVIPILIKTISYLTAFNLSVIISLESIVIGGFISVFGSLLMTLPLVLEILEIKPALLLGENEVNWNTLDKMTTKNILKKISHFIPALIGFVVLSIIQANSVKIGWYFILSITVVVLIILILFIFIWKLNSQIKIHKYNWKYKLAILSLIRKPMSSISMFLVLALGTLLINILPQLKSGIINEFTINKKSKVPDLFIFDIQDEQAEGIQSFLNKSGQKTLSMSPLVRARILKVNDLNFERQIEAQGFQTREKEEELRFRNRGVNLSFRDYTSDSEEIIKGQSILGRWDSLSGQLPQISVEYKYAERMNLKLQDHLEFDVQGISIVGVVTNLRKVKWTSFQPNFFVLFQPGVIDEAPKTYVAGISATENKNILQLQLVKQFPNISIIDVKRAFEMALELTEKMSWSLRLMSYLCLLAGFFVIYSIIRTQARQKTWDLNLMKILGASKSDIIKSHLAEVFCISFFSSLSGAVLSLFVGQFLSYFLFSNLYYFEWITPLFSIGVITILSSGVAWLASQEIFHLKPMDVFRGHT